jgi:hypothetical protein
MPRVIGVVAALSLVAVPAATDSVTTTVTGIWWRAAAHSAVIA